MYKVIVNYQRHDYRWDKPFTGYYITKEEADREHERQAEIARDLLAKMKIIDYQIATIERFER